MTNETKNQTARGNLPSEVKPQKNSIEEYINKSVMNRIEQFASEGTLDLPKNFSEANAIRSMYLTLLEVEKNGKSVLEVCTRPSIANSILKAVISGLTPAKNQIAFIPYGDKLTCQVQYQGKIALAKRVAGVKNVVARTIYENDEINYSIDPETGYIENVQHKQNFDNIDSNKIKGAYATVTFVDGSKPFVDIMTMPEIRQSWQQGATKGNSPAHKNFPSAMAGKTVINRACKLLIETSDDGALYGDDYDREDMAKESMREVAKDNANKTELDISDAEEVNDNAPFPGKQDEPEQAPEKTPEPEEKEQVKATDKTAEKKGPEPNKQDNSDLTPGRMF